MAQSREGLMKILFNYWTFTEEIINITGMNGIIGNPGMLSAQYSQMGKN